LFSIIYVIRFSKNLISPLDRLTKLAKTISGGNLDAPISADLMKNNDETSSLAESFAKMISYLKDNISKLQEYNLEIKNSRNKIRSEKKKLQQYLDVAGVFVITFDFNNLVIMINKKGQEMLGTSEDNSIGRDWIDSYVISKDRVRTRNLIGFVVSGVSPIDTLENSLIGADGKEKNIVWHFSILKNDKGEGLSVLGTGVDVTELSQAKITINQLKEVDRLKNEVLNIATHELKTPLISIVGLSEVMKKNPKTIPEEYKEYVSIINFEGEKLNRLIKSMLSVSRNELGKTIINKEAISLKEFSESIKTSLEMLTKRSDSNLIIKNNTDNITLISDREKISQVLYNFVDNAVKYGPKNQNIQMTIDLIAKDKVKMSVKGEGQGIDKAMQKKLFLKFSQLEPSLSRSQDGIGLGLYICKQSIEALGGEIGVESEAGQGATFFFTLPLNEIKKNDKNNI
jgi:PAS domain S-box-containing protein